RLIKDLAYALEVAPSELTRLPIPAPANGETDAAVQAVRLALTAVSYDMPGGQALPVAALQARVTAMIDALCRCEREREVGAALPGLIRDLHTSIAAGHDVPELLELAAWLHTQATVSWLRLAGASLDLRSQAVMLARCRRGARHCGLDGSRGRCQYEVDARRRGVRPGASRAGRGDRADGHPGVDAARGVPRVAPDAGRGGGRAPW
ncbi:MAG: hypothetical protein M3R63_14500, partial [Actinomycetota bacterium]|nr:hypothetical protein [Actinomycetota bacterium]